MLTSPLANLHQQLIIKLQSLGILSYISQDLGQLEHYNIRPAVSYPCALIDIDEMNFSDIQNDKTQMGEGFVQIRLGLIKYTDASNLTPTQYQEAALKFYEVEQAIHLLLHGWAPPVDGFERLLRRAALQKPGRMMCMCACCVTRLYIKTFQQSRCVQLCQ
jgi:hypothetical protein